MIYVSQMEIIFNIHLVYLCFHNSISGTDKLIWHEVNVLQIFNVGERDKSNLQALPLFMDCEIEKLGIHDKPVNRLGKPIVECQVSNCSNPNKFLH